MHGKSWQEQHVVMKGDMLTRHTVLNDISGSSLGGSQLAAQGAQALLQEPHLQRWMHDQQMERWG
jgi:hypothetical protein